MIINRPIQSNWKTQGFGESKACVVLDPKGEPYRPFRVKGKPALTCPVGQKDFYEALNMKGHNGTDWFAWHTEPGYFDVEADTEWWTRSYTDPDGGKGIDVFSLSRVYIDQLPPQAGPMARKEWLENEKMMYVKFRYHHIKQAMIEDSVNSDFIDSTGFTLKTPNISYGDFFISNNNTGASTGTHLHRSMKFVYKNSMTMDADNGYYGAVDYSRWYVNDFVLHVMKAKNEALTVIQAAIKMIAEVKLYIKQYYDLLAQRSDN